MTKCISLTFLLHKLSYFKLMFMMLITHLGLLKPPDEQADSPEDPIATSYVLVLEGPNPSIVTLPLHLLTSLIKKRLPVLQHSSFFERIGADHEDENSNRVCAICLDCIQKTQEIRLLRNCSHLFHKQCLDCWVDEGQVTCPLCRSMIFPAKGDRLG